MQALFLIEYPRAVFDRTALRIRRTIIETGDSRVSDRPRTHGAGFQCHPKLAAVQTLISQNTGRLPNRKHLCVGSGIV